MDLSDQTIEISEEAFQLFRILPDDFDNSPDFLLDRVLHPDSLHDFKQALQMAIEKNVVFRHDYKIFKTDGTEGWVRINGDVSVDEISGHRVLVGTFQDITAEVLERDAVRENYYFLKTLVEALPNPVYYKDSNGVFQFCNDAFLEFIGFRKDEIIGHKSHDFEPKEFADIYSHFDEELLFHRGRQKYETKILCADKSLHDVIFDKATVTGPSGMPAGIVGMIQDVSEQNDIERQLVTLHKVKDVFIELNYEIVNLETLSDFFPVMLIKLFLVFENCSIAAVYEKAGRNKLQVLCNIGGSDSEAEDLGKSIVNQCMDSNQTASKDCLCIQNKKDGHMYPILEALMQTDPSDSFTGIFIPVSYESQIRWIISLQSSKLPFVRSDLTAAQYIQEEIPILIRMIDLYLSNLSFARYDYLTGVMCRGYFTTALEEELASHAAQKNAQASSAAPEVIPNSHLMRGPSLYLAAFDLNGLKKINDQFGHQAGDIYIQAFAGMLKDRFRDADLIGRLGGDEFACVIFAGSLPEAQQRLTDFQTEFAQKEIRCDRGSFQGGFGFGVAAYGADSTDKDRLLQIADQRMYENKKIQLSFAPPQSRL